MAALTRREFGSSYCFDYPSRDEFQLPAVKRRVVLGKKPKGELLYFNSRSFY